MDAGSPRPLVGTEHAMRIYPYPFVEFVAHLRAWRTVRLYTSVRMHYVQREEALDVGDERTLGADLTRMMDYLAQGAADPDPHSYKALTVVSVVHYLARHRDRFRSAGLLVRAPSGRERPTYALVVALHGAFTERRTDERPELDEVLARASTVA